MPTTFKQFINEIKLTSLSSWQYELPQNKEKQISDFYMLTYLPKKVNDQELNHHLQNCINILLTSLKEELLKDLFFAISQEIEHFFDMADLKKNIKYILNKKQVRALGNYKKSMGFEYKLDYEDEDEKEFAFKYRNIFQGENEEDYRALVSSLTSGLTEKQFVQMCKALFESNYVEWDEVYGGKIWGYICQAWLNLYNSKTLDNIMVWIDHIYDLEHNTGSLFTKLNSYDFDLNLLLNLKRDLKSSYEILHKVSPKMKALALPIIKTIKKSGEPLLVPRKDQLKDLEIDELLRHTYGNEIYFKAYYKTKPKTFLEKYFESPYRDGTSLLNKLNTLKIDKKTYRFNNVSLFNSIFDIISNFIYREVNFGENLDIGFLALRDIIVYSITKEKNINDVKPISELHLIFKTLKNYDNNFQTIYK